MKCPYCGGNIEIQENITDLLEYRCPYCDGIVKTESNEPKTKFGAARKMKKDYLEYLAKEKQAKREAELKQQEEIRKHDRPLTIIFGIVTVLIFSAIFILAVKQG